MTDTKTGPNETVRLLALGSDLISEGMAMSRKGSIIEHYLGLLKDGDPLRMLAGVLYATP